MTEIWFLELTKFVCRRCGNTFEGLLDSREKNPEKSGEHVLGYCIECWKTIKKDESVYTGGEEALIGVLTSP